MNKTVIGLVGEASAGKGEIASYLQKNGFSYYSLSDTLRSVATSLGLSHERETLISFGNTLRETLGSDILARGAKRQVEAVDNNKVVIDGIRNPGELRFLQHELGAFIIGVTMSPEKRFQLMKEKNRPGDPKTQEEFIALQKCEEGIGQSENGQQVKRCLDLSDAKIQNDGTLEELHAKTAEIALSRGITLEGYSPKGERI